MYQLPVNKKYSQLNTNELLEVDEFKKDYWEKSRERETFSIDDLVKYLWISNGSGVTISFGLFQSKGVLSELQFYGCISFLIGIVTLLLMKVLSEILSSRDRYRFNKIYNDFINDIVMSDSLVQIRDKSSRFWGLTSMCMRYFSCVTFILGVSLFLISYKC